MIPIYTVIFISGIARGFITPALFSYMPQLIPRELYSNAVTAGTAPYGKQLLLEDLRLGGFFYGFMGITVSYMADVFLMCTGLLLAVCNSQKSLTPENEEQGVVEKIRSGLEFCIQKSNYLRCHFIGFVCVLFGGAVALLPIFANEILLVGQEGLGILRSAPSVGAMLMAFYITHHPDTKKIQAKFFCFVLEASVSA